MAQANRHEAILQCIASAITTELSSSTDPVRNEVRVEDFPHDAEPTLGITVSDYGINEDLLGTNERDDITYSTSVIRCISALHNEDRTNRIEFLTTLRLLFNRKRIACDDGCQLYAYIKQGKTKMPDAWERSNNSISLTLVNTIVRETRVKE